MPIPVVDIFAGPGGLGEGFSAFRTVNGTQRFRIAVSAEMDLHASTTLRLRAFFRQFPDGEVPKSYYQYVAGTRSQPWTDATSKEWQRAGEEARQMELGNPSHDAQLDELIARGTRGTKPWVLIGGPPCQAYSLIGRARNLGTKAYVADADERHFLYRHYLRILARHRPAAFIMENVKGILSSRVGGEKIFPQILRDLHLPGGRGGPRYRVIPVVDRVDPDGHDSKDFIIRAEHFGVPQARHRVILLGLAEDIPVPTGHLLRALVGAHASVADAIGDLPRLRSTVTDLDVRDWAATSAKVLKSAGHAARQTDRSVAARLRQLSDEARHHGDPGVGQQHMLLNGSGRSIDGGRLPAHLKRWMKDRQLRGHLNHQTRGHMEEDLKRYGYAAAFAQHHGRSPRGPAGFPELLHPQHRNWAAGKKFVDRFNVQLSDGPSSTITSHLAKDGHYFIHPDPTQLRSLTVREAARLQTFPDNYFFEGPPGSQRKQVGNAVPPWLAHQIASVVSAALAQGS